MTTGGSGENRTGPADEQPAGPADNARPASDSQRAGDGQRPGDSEYRGAIPRQPGASCAPDGAERPAAARLGAEGARPAAVPPQLRRPVRPTGVSTQADGSPSTLDGGVAGPVAPAKPAAGAAAAGTAATGGAAPRRHWRGRWRWLIVGSAVVVVVVGLAGWVVVRGLMARAALGDARARIAALQVQVQSGGFPSATELRAQVAEIARRAHAARSLTGDPVWSALGHVPWAGCPLRSAGGLVRAVDTLATTGLPAAADLGVTLDPSRLRSQLTVNIDALRSARGPALRAAAALETLRVAAVRAPVCGWVGETTGVDEARAELIRRGSTLGGALNNIALAARLGPQMLGASGPRRYLLVVQNPGESRANGGIIGGFGLLTATRGSITLDGIAGNGALPGGPTQATPGSMLPASFAARYGAFWPDRVWANANLTPDYPTAGRLYTGLYRAGTGIDVDGTISVDPTTLSYLLAAANRPAVLADGQVITADNLVDLVESKVYATVPTVAGRDRFFADVGQATYAAVALGASDNTRVLTALARAAREGRLTVSSNHADEQDQLSATALGGALPTGNGPYLAVVTQNATASKLDYWLRRSTRYSVRRMPGGAGAATIVIRLTNTAPDGLSAYVRNREDEARSDGNPGAQNNIWLSIYTGRDSLFAGAHLDGRPIGLTTGSEDGLPVVSTYLTIDRGQTRTLELKVLEPRLGSALAVRPQPLPVAEHLDVEGVPVTTPWSRRVGD